MSLAPAAAQDEIAVDTVDLGDGLYMIATGRAGNIGVLVGEDGVFMIDAQFERFAGAIEAAVRVISEDRPVDLLLNTHWHYDHVDGNAYFAAQGAIIAAHKNVRPRLETPQNVEIIGSTTEPLSPAHRPVLNLGDRFTINWNVQTAEVFHTPNAHTDGDLFIHFIEADVIHAGDLLFSGLYPYIDLDAGGTVDGFIAGMEAIIARAGPETRIIAGHGPLSMVEDLEASIAMLRESQARVGALVAAGADLEAVLAANPLEPFHEDWTWGFITTERMTWTIYRDITGRTE